MTRSEAPQAQSAGGVPDGRDRHEPGQLKVVDHAGTFRGTIAHIDFDPASRAITQFAAHKGGMLGIGGLSHR